MFMFKEFVFVLGLWGLANWFYLKMGVLFNGGYRLLSSLYWVVYCVEFGDCVVRCDYRLFFV